MNKVDVVVIDDDEGVRWVIQELLDTRKISCSVARNGQEGLQLVFKHRPALAIVDIKLGAMNGLDVARLISKNYKNIKILLITGYKETVNGQIDAAMPVMGIIEKPFDVMELLDLDQPGAQRQWGGGGEAGCLFLMPDPAT
ncbi:MAG: response regulator, partial [Bacillota bacterium]